MNSPKDPNFCNPTFWEERYKKSNNYSQAIQAISDWNAVGEEQKKVCEQFIEGKVFDAGCGYGRIIEFLPWSKITEYIGMDITPIFIEEAKRLYPNHKFILGDIRNTGFNDKVFDWGIVIGIADSIYWPEMEKELKRICKKLLILRCEKPKEYIII